MATSNKTGASVIGCPFLFKKTVKQIRKRYL